MLPLETYLTNNNVDPVRLSVCAGVRYLTVWKAMKGQPIAVEQAQKIRVALQRITGTVYTGTLVTLQEKPIEELPTLPIRKLPRTIHIGKKDTAISHYD